MGSIEGAVNISSDGSRGEYLKLPKESGNRGVHVPSGCGGLLQPGVLMQHGYDVVNLNGGY